MYKIIIHLKKNYGIIQRSIVLRFTKGKNMVDYQEVSNYNL